MQRRTTDQVTMPDVIRDESGSVMTEFLIVMPFLLTVFFGIMFYTDLNRFNISAHEHSYVQAWKGVAQNNKNLSNSDDLTFTSYELFAGISIPSQILDLVDMRHAIILYPAATGGNIRAALIYGIGNISIEGIANFFGSPSLSSLSDAILDTPYGIQGMPRKTLDRRELQLTELGGSGNLTYRNTTYLTPLMGAANSFVGYKDEGGAYINITDVTVPARMSIINDPYSVYWNNKGKRLRYVDRFTLIRDPVYAVTAIVQTAISGNIGIITQLSTIADDLGYSAFADALSFLNNPIIQTIGSLLDFKEQAQPFRKVDKRMDQQHDVNLKADYGKEEIPSDLKLQNKNSSKWEAIQ